MEVKQEMVSLSNVHDAYSGVCLVDTTSTLAANLTKFDIDRYANALHKIQRGAELNRKDLALFDKIDAITFEVHGMCLKDSQVTKARLKACKKYHIEFIDRNQLIDHMNLMLPAAEEPCEVDFHEAFGQFMASRLGAEAMHEMHDLICKVEYGGELTLADLKLLSEFEEVASDELDWSIINEDIKSAIDRASKELGVYFQNLQKVVTH